MKKINKREKVEIDGEYFSQSSKKELEGLTALEALKKNREEILKIAYRQLKARAKSRFEIYKKLAEKGFLESEINPVLDELEANKIIDDYAYVLYFLESYQKTRPYGFFALKHKLREKGVEETVFEQAIADYYLENSLLEEAYHLLKGRFYKYADLQKHDKIKKITAYLFNRGFDYPLIEDVLKKLEDEDLLSDL